MTEPSEYLVRLRPLSWQGESWSDAPPDRRVKAFLKLAFRLYGLKATLVRDGPPELLWAGWLHLPSGWVLTCLTADEDSCARVLAETERPGVLGRRVLPRGQLPGEGVGAGG